MALQGRSKNGVGAKTGRWLSNCGGREIFGCTRRTLRIGGHTHKRKSGILQTRKIRGKIIIWRGESNRYAKTALLVGAAGMNKKDHRRNIWGERAGMTEEKKRERREVSPSLRFKGGRVMGHSIGSISTQRREEKEEYRKRRGDSNII